MEPITREEKYLSAIVKGEQIDTKPITRKEQYLYAIANKTDVNVEPVTRQDALLSAWSAKKSGILLQDKTITENGTYTADEGYDGLGSVTVEVAGAGGLEAGAYLRQLGGTKPYVSSSNAFFEYNNKLYLYTLSKYGDTKYDIYLYENDTYTLVVSDVLSVYLNYFSVIEFHGLVHFIGNDSTWHYVWDGESSFTSKTTVPYSTAANSAFVLDDTLYVKTERDGFYKWVEDSETWEAVAITGYPTSSSYEAVVIYNETIYICGYGYLYRVDWENGTCISVASDLPSASGRGIALVGKYLYLDNHGKLYKYDMENFTSQFVVTLPSNQTDLFCYNNQLRINGSASNIARLNAVLYEVAE